MFDIETLSTFPNAALLAVAIVVMDDKKPKQQDWMARGWFIDPNLTIGHVNPETMDFWNDQPNQVKSLVFAGNDTPREVLQSINGFLGSAIDDVENGDYLCYADPAAFDFPILIYQYQQCGMIPGWHWRKQRCMGAMRKALEEEAEWEIDRVEAELKHHPVHDALAQMHELKNVLKAYHSIKVLK
jgi:hypothetical protein